MDGTLRTHQRKENRNRSQLLLGSTRTRRRAADADGPSGSMSSPAHAENALPATRVQPKKNPRAFLAPAPPLRHADPDGMAIDRHAPKTRTPTRRASGDASRGSTPFIDLREPKLAHKRRGKERAAVDGEEDVGAEVSSTYSGAIAVAEFERLKAEVESLKKQLEDSKKICRRQVKVVTKLKVERKQHSDELQQLKDASRVNEEIISTFEINMQCTVCMEPMLKPYALPPCGHVYCYSCLHRWFSNAPVHEDDMVDEGDEALLHRRKSCPTCRAAVISRPVPLFLVKTLTGALLKARAPEGQRKSASPPPSDEDPWQGIFYPLEDDWSDDDGEDTGVSDSDDESDDSDEDSDEEVVQRTFEYRYGTPSDIEVDPDVEYAPARWAPPSVAISPVEYDLGALRPLQLALLRRGASLPMIERYSMRYLHGHGISAQLRPTHTVFLGWNIDLHPEDPLGQEYMEWIDRDIDNHPDRWESQVTANGAVTSWRLSAVDDDEPDWDTTDSEAYMAEADASDDELDMFA